MLTLKDYLLAEAMQDDLPTTPEGESEVITSPDKDIVGTIHTIDDKKVVIVKATIITKDKKSGKYVHKILKTKPAK